MGNQRSAILAPFLSTVLACVSLVHAQAATRPVTRPATQPFSPQVVDGNDPDVRAFLDAAQNNRLWDVHKLIETGIADGYPTIGFVGLQWFIDSPMKTTARDARMVYLLIRNEKLRALEHIPAGWTPSRLLVSAAYAENEAAVDALWKEGVRPDAEMLSPPRDWPAVRAVNFKNSEVPFLLPRHDALRLLRKIGVPLSIHQAALIGDDERVAELVAAKADLNGPPSACPLSFAAGQDHLSVVNLLLAAGATPNPDLMSDGPENWLQRGSPLQMAAGGGHVAVVERLLAAGADPDQPLPRRKAGVVDYLREQSKNEPNAAHPNWPRIIELIEAASRNKTAGRPTTQP